MTAPRYFRARIVQGGPFVGVRLFTGPPIIDGDELDRSPHLQVMVGDETTSRAVLMLGNGGIPVEVEGVTLRSIEPIAAATYRFMVAFAEWARLHNIAHPKANPRRPVDFHKLPLPF